MKVFVAASMRQRARASSLAKLLRRDGHEVISRWHDGDPPPPAGADVDTAGILLCRRTRLEIESCEAFILVGSRRRTRGGAMVEYALAGSLGKRLVIVGRVWTPMVGLFASERVADEADLLDLIAKENS